MNEHDHQILSLTFANSRNRFVDIGGASELKFRVQCKECGEIIWFSRSQFVPGTNIILIETANGKRIKLTYEWVDDNAN